MKAHPTVRLFTLLVILGMFGCTSNLNMKPLYRGGGNGLVSFNLAERDPVPAPKPVSEVSSATTPAGMDDYDFSVEEVQFRESTFLSDGRQAPSVRLVAKNRGYAPVSVTITLDRDVSENMRRDATMPQTSVVPPRSELVVARFDPVDNRSHWKLAWHSFGHVGDYTAQHSSRERYRCPIADKMCARASIPGKSGSNPCSRNAVMFSAPVGAGVVAARSGAVVRIEGNNDVSVLHDDATIATYSHLGKVAEGIREGKAVRAGDPLGTAGKMADQAAVLLTVWRPEPLATVTLEHNERSGFQTVSFPLEFSIGRQDCRVLTRNHRVAGKPSK